MLHTVQSVRWEEEWVRNEGMGLKSSLGKRSQVTLIIRQGHQRCPSGRQQWNQQKAAGNMVWGVKETK